MENQKISETQLLFLDNLIYLNNIDMNNLSIYEIIKKALDDLDNCTANNPCNMTKLQWKELLESFLNNKENEAFLKDYTIQNYETNDTDENGLRACCFVKESNGNIEDVVAVFRGTSGVNEWKDDLMMANAVSSEIMDDAAIYIKNLPEKYGNNITVTGHSNLIRL